MEEKNRTRASTRESIVEQIQGMGEKSNINRANLRRENNPPTSYDFRSLDLNPQQLNAPHGSLTTRQPMPGVWWLELTITYVALYKCAVLGETRVTVFFLSLQFIFLTRFSTASKAAHYWDTE
ncbi:hypothetical protein PoB_002446800 [Plakobranchus ocellatus]|uniref:Uncharacterized protein n=1 Tax=Plakobranchus ocellatus TaxID=259542 RepID=A0AAV3ZU55_9GAST|nr:hypothetical protein PoB_002446800 [Plakobranchus ocellatus]